MSETVGFKDVIKDRNFLKIYLSGIISRFGDAVDSIAFSYMVYELTGSASLMALLFAVNGIPALVFSMISGVVVTYMRKKTVVYVCDLLRGTVVVITAVLYHYGLLEVWHLFLFTVLNSTFEMFREPAASVLFIDIVGKEKVEHAQSLNTSGRTFAELVGFSVAAFIIGIIGVSGAIFLDGITFFISALIVIMIRIGKEKLKKEKLTLSLYMKDLREGLAYSFSLPVVRFVILFIGMAVVVFMPFNTMQTPYVLEDMQLDVIGLSVMSVSFMASMIVGSMMIPTLTKKLSRRRVFIFGGVIVGFGYFSLGLIEFFAGSFAGYVALAVSSIIMGSTIGFMNIPLSVVLMRKVDREMLPRVSSFSSILGLSLVPITAGLVSFLVRYIEIRHMFMVMGIATMILFASLTFNRTLYEFNDEE